MEKVNRYELIKDLENDPKFFNLIKKGIISLSLLARKCYYEKYLQELETNGKRMAVSKAADEYNISERSVYYAIEYMEES